MKGVGEVPTQLEHVRQGLPATAEGRLRPTDTVTREDSVQVTAARALREGPVAPCTSGKGCSAELQPTSQTSQGQPAGPLPNALKLETTEAGFAVRVRSVL